MTDRWRYACPRGHRSVRKSQSGGWKCHTCGRTYDRVKDLKTDEAVGTAVEATEVLG